MIDLISREDAIAAIEGCRIYSEAAGPADVGHEDGLSEAQAALRALPAQGQIAAPGREAMARQVYASMVYASHFPAPTEKEAAWVERGNSLMQVEARQCVERILSALEGVK